MKRTSLLLLTCIMAFTLMAQIPQDPTYGLTPNAKSFQRYGDIPVSLYTGTPNITIPLDTIHDGTLSLPVALSYHCGGVKADEHPGWVGLGWTLLLGGAITREVRDLPDEISENLYPKRGYYYEHSYKDLIWANNEASINDFINGLSRGHIGFYDTEPDKFNFQFGEYSGFFVLDPTGKWQVHSNRPLKVKTPPTFGQHPIINGVKQHEDVIIFKSFTLIADDGTEYEFGDDAIDYSINIRLQITCGWNAIAWHLKKIKHPNGDAISFEYERNECIASISHCDEIRAIKHGMGSKTISSSGYEGSLMSPVYLTAVNGKMFQLQLHNSISEEKNYNNNIYSDVIDNLQGGTETPQYLNCGIDKKLEGKIAMIKWRKLDDITFINEKSQKYKHVKFDYICNSSTRLALKSLTFSNRFGITEETYSFKYHNLIDMPEYLAKQTDHWGYYNGSLPSDPDSKKPNVETLMYGTLEEIRYPYGGKTQFVFEPHDYSKITNKEVTGDLYSVRDSITGGVRIRKITDIPNDSTPAVIREFRYVYDYKPEKSNYRSSGILEGYPAYTNQVQTDIGIISMGSSVSLSHIVNSSGLHIGYPEAVEIHGDGSYEIHRFTSCLDAKYRDVPPLLCSESTRFVPISSMSHYRGFPIESNYHDSTGKMLRSSRYEYGQVASDAMFAPGALGALVSFGGILYLRFSFYKNFVYNLVQIKNEECDYGVTGSNPFVRTSYKRYNRYGQLKSDSLVVSVRDNQTASVTKYSYEWETNPNFSVGFFMQYVNEISRKRGNGVPDITKYGYSLNDTIPFISSIGSCSGTSIRPLYNCHHANAKGGPIDVTYSDGVPVIYLWGRDYLHPRAVIKGYEPSVIESALGFPPERAPDYSFTLSDRLDVLREKLPMCEVTEYTYTPHTGVTSITDPTGRTQFYNYDPYGRLISIQDARKDLLTDYQYSSESSQIGEDSDMLIKKYLDSNISIIGPYNIYPDTPCYFWADIDDLGLPYRWSVEAPDGTVTMSTHGKYVILQASDNCELSTPINLKLTVFDRDGNELWSQKRDMIYRAHYYTMNLEKRSVSTESVEVIMSIYGPDRYVKVPKLTVFVNGKYLRNIIYNAGNSSTFVMEVINIPRDYNNDIYQIQIHTEMDEFDTWVFSADELFSPIEQK